MGLYRKLSADNWRQTILCSTGIYSYNLRAYCPFFRSGNGCGAAAPDSAGSDLRRRVGRQTGAVEEFKALYSSDMNLLFVENHGVFLAADSVKELDALLESTVAAVERAEVKR